MKFPAGWSTGSAAAKSYPSISAYTPLAGKSATSSFPSLSSWRPSAPISYPSFGGLGSAGSDKKPATSSFPSLSSWTSGGSAPKLPSWPSAPTWQPPGAASSFSPSAGNSTPGSVADSPFRLFQMPSGFSGGALGGAPTAAPSGGRAPTSQPAASAPRPPAQSAAQPTRASQPASASRPYVDHSKSHAGSVSYVGGPSQTQSSITGPGALRTGVPGAGTVTGTDQWGRTFHYNDTAAHAGQPVAGVSNTGTVLRIATNADGSPVVGRDGQPVIYDTGVAAFVPAQPRPAPPQQSVAVNPAPSAYIPRQPSQDEIDTANQGKWLG